MLPLVYEYDQLKHTLYTSTAPYNITSTSLFLCPYLSHFSIQYLSKSVPSLSEDMGITSNEWQYLPLPQILHPVIISEWYQINYDSTPPLLQFWPVWHLKIKNNIHLWPCFLLLLNHLNGRGPFFNFWILDWYI